MLRGEKAGLRARAGFVPEGTLRGSAWVDGAFADETILGLLATEWSHPRR